MHSLLKYFVQKVAYQNKLPPYRVCRRVLSGFKEAVFKHSIIDLFDTQNISVLFGNGFYAEDSRISLPDSNRLFIGDNIAMSKSLVDVRGKNNVIRFGERCTFTGAHFVVLGDNNVLSIGNNCAFDEGCLVVVKGGHQLSIGNGVLCGVNSIIRNNDGHDIFDKEGRIINPDSDLVIGNHVWVGTGATILKSGTITDEVVIGAGSVVTKPIEQSKTVVAGNPARVIKTDVHWG